MLNSGIVPNIYAADELSKVREDCLKKYKASGNTNESPDTMHEWFFNKVKDNMHLAILMSPVGASFRNYCRQYPALINNTTIDWFMPWPEEALIEVANKFLGKIDLDEKSRRGLANLSGYAHKAAQDQSDRMKKELKRIFYVTPTNFIELLKGYTKMLDGKRIIIGTQADKLRNGLTKLASAREDVKKMTIDSDIKRAEVAKKSQECDILIVNAESDRYRQDKDCC